MPGLREKLGVCQWFHHEARRDLARAARLLHELGVRHVRTGISWADWHRPRGDAWIAHVLETLSDFELLVSVWHTPPSISEGGTCASPPRALRDYADFLDLVLDRHGDRIAALELWNEPNNRLKWDFARFDPTWSKFGEMVGMAGHWARCRGMPTVLGGMIPVDPHWLAHLGTLGVLDHVDAVGIHGFPYMWWDDAPNWDWYRHWHGWPAKVALGAREARGLPIWVTEAGLATWDLPNARPGRHALQVRALEEAAAAPAARVYWYCLEDLDPARAAIEGFHVDENEYHLGLVDWAGHRKPAWYRMKELLAGDTRADRPALVSDQSP